MNIGEEKKYLVWLNHNRRLLQKYRGQWVGLLLGKGVVVADKNLRRVHNKFLKLYPDKKPHLLHIPPKGEKFYILVIR